MLLTSALARTELRTAFLEDNGLKEVVREGKRNEAGRKLDEDERFEGN